MIRIKDRLVSLAKYVNPEDKIMDVGCDHALMDIYLVQNNYINGCYVGDVNPNALQNGIDNIEKNGLSKNIIPILSYGIEKIDNIDVDTLIISGMGSKTIIDILSSPNVRKIYKLILQSNNNYSDLRRFLTTIGFNIYDEEVIEENGKTYINILAARNYNIHKYSDIEYEFGPILIQNPNNIEYFEKLYNSYEDIYFQSRNESIKMKMNQAKEIIVRLKNL